MISELRQRIRMNCTATITAEEYDRLQAEWIVRSGAEDMVAIERKACAGVADAARNEAERIGKLHPEDSASRDRMFARARVAQAIADEIMARSNV